MKKLGLIGGTGPESTLIYYKELTSGVQKRLKSNVFPHLSIESLSVFEVLDFCERKDYAGLAAYLADGIRNLAAAGAELAAFTGITPHIVFDEVSKQAPIPIVSMVDASCEYAVKKGYRKIALLGTIPTMRGDFFPKPFRRADIAVITPNDAEMDLVGRKIETELEYGIVNPETQTEFEKIARRLIEEENAQAVVLGCTELPLIFNGISLPVDKMDVMRIHIDTLISEIVQER